jgi:transposase-like protein
MEKKEKQCPKCGSKERQIKRGFTTNGSQRMKCKKCGAIYTPQPKHHGYSEETRKEALRLLTLGNTGRSVGKALGMSKANAYRWAREEVKKTGAGVDKSSDQNRSI